MKEDKGFGIYNKRASEENLSVLNSKVCPHLQKYNEKNNEFNRNYIDDEFDKTVKKNPRKKNLSQI